MSDAYPPVPQSRLAYEGIFLLLSAAEGPSESMGTTASYRFDILQRRLLHARPVGFIELRIGKPVEDPPNNLYYYGHIGYLIEPPYRGHHYAQHACRAVLPFAAACGLESVLLTCNPDNIPSRRTIRALGAELLGTVPLPKGHPLYALGDREKQVYRLELAAT